jgi:hypothetical protein
MIADDDVRHIVTPRRIALFDGIIGHVLTFDGDAAQFAEESSQNPAIVQSENAQEYDDVNIKVIRLSDLRGSIGIIFEDFVAFRRRKVRLMATAFAAMSQMVDTCSFSRLRPGEQTRHHSHHLAASITANDSANFFSVDVGSATLAGNMVITAKA